MKLTEINYLSEPSPEYAKQLTGAAKSLKSLRAFADKWMPLASDAHAAIMQLDEKSFPEFVEHLRKERRGRFSGAAAAARWGDVLMPRVLFAVQMFALEYKVPWGAAYIRLRDAGKIEERAGRAFITSPLI